MSYTYSKALGNTSGPVAVNDNNIAGGDPQNNFCLKCEYGPSASDSRHILNASWVYQMPFGRGKQFGSTVPLWLDEVIGGWTVSGSAALFSGQPNTITANGSSGATGAGTLRANHYRPMKLSGHRVDGWYETTGGGSYAPNPERLEIIAEFTKAGDLQQSSIADAGAKVAALQHPGIAMGHENRV